MDNVKIMLMKMENENRIMCMVPMEKEHAGADEPGHNDNNDAGDHENDHERNTMMITPAQLATDDLGLQDSPGKRALHSTLTPWLHYHHHHLRSHFGSSCHFAQAGITAV